MFNELVIVDLDDPSTLKNVNGQFEAIIHVAAASYGAPADLMRVTGIATELLARRAIALDVKRFVHVSAMSVYGRPNVPVVSSTTPIKHSTPYGAAKWAAECYLHDLQDRIPSISVRSPAIVGPLLGTHTHFLANVLRAMLIGTENIRISNPDFLFNNIIHQETLAEFLVRLSQSSLHGFRALPVGSAQSESLIDLVEYMSKRMGYSGRLSWDSSKSPPFAIKIDEAVAMGCPTITAGQTLDLWLSDGSESGLD